MGNRRPQKTVRVGQFDRAMDQFHAELGSKISLVLAEYHRNMVEPRLEWLELPWYIRLYRQYWPWYDGPGKPVQFKDEPQKDEEVLEELEKAIGEHAKAKRY